MRPRWTASRSESLPVNGARAAELVLPAYDPVTWMLVLMVLTLVVAPGTGCCEVATDPDSPARPESGNWAALDPAGVVVGAPN